MSPPPPALLRATVIIIALAGMAYIARDLSNQTPKMHQTSASAIEAGINRSHLIADEDAEEGAISDDLESAGAIWAKDRHAISEASCPAYSPAFIKGCVDYIEDARADRKDQTR